jgi:SAM-dependent methyltransferase
MAVLDRVLGTPWVYEYVRPLATGGLDYSRAYHRLRVNEDSVVLDLGCGTGDALRYLAAFTSYHGIDTDERATTYAKSRWRARSNVEFESRLCTPEDVRTIAPTHVAMIGLLHHLDDAQAVEVLQMVKQSPRLVRVLTLDIVYLPGHPYNNFLARRDRGRFCRDAAGYVALAERSGFRVVERAIEKSHPVFGFVKYAILVLEP